MSYFCKTCNTYHLSHQEQQSISDYIKQHSIPPKPNFYDYYFEPENTKNERTDNTMKQLTIYDFIPEEPTINTTVYYELEDQDGNPTYYTSTIKSIHQHPLTLLDTTIHPTFYYVDDTLGLQRNAFYTLPELFHIKDNYQLLTSTLQSTLSERQQLIDDLNHEFTSKPDFLQSNTTYHYHKGYLQALKDLQSKLH